MAMKKIISLLIFWSAITGLFGQNADQYLDMANKAFDAGKTEEAKALYNKAALRNNAEAHFQLSYRYVLTDDERLYHLLEATKAGHEEATFYLFQEAFKHTFDFDSVAKLVLSAYETGKTRNPKLTFVFANEDNATLKHCVEAGTKEMDLFLKKQGLTLVQVGESGAYSIWRLASDISYGKYGTPSPIVILQLACRDGFASAEKDGAVQAAYESYKAGEVLKFNVCDYITSGYGQGFCAQWRAEEAEKDYKQRIKKLKGHVSRSAVQLLDTAYANASKFFDAKAEREEGSGGTGRAAWVIGSEMMQRSEWLSLIERADSGFLPGTWSKDTTADKKLNATYRQAIRLLRTHPIAGFNAPPVTDTDLVYVQKLWIPYRDSTAKLCAAIMPSIGEAMWKDWLTAERIEQLKNVIETSKSLIPGGK